MIWLLSLALLLCGLAIASLAAGGAETPGRMRTFNQSSPAELRFHRRARRLQNVGYFSLGGAIALGVAICALLYWH